MRLAGRPKFQNRDPALWNWIGNLILKLVCYLQLFDLSSPSVLFLHLKKMVRANGKMTQKYAKLKKWPKITFQGQILISEVAFWGLWRLDCIEKWS